MKSKKTILKSISVLILISALILSGCINQNQTENNNEDNSSIDNLSVVAIVNGENIYEEDVIVLKNFHFNNTGTNISNKFALDLLINETLLIQEAKKEGYYLTDEMAKVRLFEIFGEENYTFNEIEQLLEDGGSSIEEFIEETSIHDYMTDTLANMSFDLTVTQVEAEFEKQLLSMLNMTLEEYKEILVQRGYSYQQEFEKFTKTLKEKQIIETLTQKAEIIYI